MSINLIEYLNLTMIRQSQFELQQQQPLVFQQPASFINAKFVKSPNHSSSPNYETINSILIAKTTQNAEIAGKRLNFEQMSQSQFINMKESVISGRSSDVGIEKTYKGNYNIRESLVAKDRVENICKNFMNYFGNQQGISKDKIPALYSLAYSRLDTVNADMNGENLQQLFNVYDQNKDGRIGLEDLMSLATRYLSQQKKKIVYTRQVQQRLQVARRLFKMFDKEQRGYLTQKQIPFLLNQTYRSMGKSNFVATQDDVRSWMAIVDEDKDGRVHLEEYEISIIRSLKKQGVKIYDD